MLKLYNSMTRSKQEFKPRVPGQVKIFTCGPSTYRRPHIGNYRTFLYEDLVVRYLEYRGFQVNRLINFTDVEDKMLQEAVELGSTPGQIAEEVSRHFFAETALLKIKLPATIARASTSVEAAVDLIQKLIAKGVAYWHEGNVFFDPLKYPGFGRLYRLDMDQWPERKVRFKKDTYNGMRWNRGDFILWHGHKEGDLSVWDTPIGRGRPSWNIQDPAMVAQNLGFEIDINCGGIDNIYRHHDYNIAVIESVSGTTYANYFLHGAHLIVDGKPMSKSRGNILYPQDVLDWGYQPHHLRFFLIRTHYRKRLNLTRGHFRAEAEHLDSLRDLVAELLRDGGQSAREACQDRIDALTGVFEKAMDDDLAAGLALEGLFKSLKEIRAHCAPLSPSAAQLLRERLTRIDQVLGVLL
jgi:cysteinyl-tRNA synthetase